ncbi:hypothetical protein ACFOED_07080 [Vulcaniibacterium thermophilum]|uniref:Uncharacterized protein n=1 Tax=Vulcaniibacterium thermophilum TaxID=1169913 RepID=A0A919DBG6_9GAMM|nr:hypothetical protein [Vulcaniibacterium thermophilum]GHE29929.1 hypothetical protein GCM10007167_09740 [Vulcaniibacterium thermophilum]
MTRASLLVLLALADAAHAATPLGRLFYTPEQRQALAAARAGGAKATADAPTAATPAPAAPRVLALTGIVERPGQASVAWINGQPVEDGATLHGYRVRIAPRGVRLVPARGAARTLAVGQTLDLDAGTVRDRLEPGAVSVEDAR